MLNTNPICDVAAYLYMGCECFAVFLIFSVNALSQTADSVCVKGSQLLLQTYDIESSGFAKPTAEQ